jgi:hypothetical protein
MIFSLATNFATPNNVTTDEILEKAKGTARCQVLTWKKTANNFSASSDKIIYLK